MLQKTFLNKKLRMSGGAFRITNSQGTDNGEGKHSLSGRVAYLAANDTLNNKALHLGFSSNFSSIPKDTYDLNIENETHTGGSYIKSGKIRQVKNLKQIGTELGYSYKRFCLQSEYMKAFVRLNSTNSLNTKNLTRDFNSYYLMTSYFIGKGQREYNKGGNKFSSIKIDRKNTKDSYQGVWEVGLRFSRIFLKESLEEIKKMSDVTIGVNWYYNPNSRLMLNYIMSQIQDTYWAHALQMRFQVTF
jgi:phosphate-selective porin OprO/OprP